MGKQSISYVCWKFYGISERNIIIMDATGQYDPDEECNRLIKRIEKICEVRGLSNYALAKAAGISKSALHDLMSGRTKPQLYTLYKLCNALNVSVEELLGDKLNGENYKLSSDEQGFLMLYRYLSEEKKSLLNVYINMLRQYKE